MGSLGFINAKITCTDCDSEVFQPTTADDRNLYMCKCEQFDMRKIDLFSDVPPEQTILKIKKAFDELHWEIEAEE